MMSNPPSSLHQAPKPYHRRQNSTPVVAFEAMKVSSNTPTIQQRQGVHRRGLSFDQHNRSPIRRQQPGGMVSITNVAQQLGQQILREAQQQRASRPGQQTDLPVQHPQGGMYPGSTPNTPYETMTMNSIMQSSPHMQFANSPYYPPDISSMQAGYQGMGGVDENSQHYFQQLHQAQQQPNAVFDARRMSQPELRVQTGMRPHTPQDQIQTAQFPLTPPTTQTVHHTIQYSRSQLGSPAIHSPLPVPMQRGRSLQGIIEHEESRPQPEIRQRPQSMLATPTKQPQSFEVAEIPVPNMARSPTRTPIIQAEQPHSSPLPFFDSTGGSPAPSLSNNPIPVLSSSQAQEDGSQSPSRNLALSPRRMSISDLNLEPGIQASIQETNVNLDDIAQFIEGPDPSDQKWICKFDDCNKRFGRKENIKSHVQTHLGDRQFRCDHCKKCFVRGHDLKRHAKIHTGSKPYPCLCGNSFARHDALTRHRQRGMCIGAFEGVVKKEVKRGRPRKHRPEMDDRVDKADRTRNAVNDNSGDIFDQYNSSGSSCSYSSWGSPPTENMDNLSMQGHNSPFASDDIALFGVPQGNMGMGLGMGMNDNMAFPPDMFSFTPPASPGYSTGNKPSPSHTHRSLTPSEALVDLPMQRQGSQYTSPHMQPRGSHHASPLIQHGLPVIQGVPIITADTTTVRASTMPMSIQTGGHSLPSLSQASSSPVADVAAFDFADMPITTGGMRMSGMTAIAPAKLEGDRNEFDAYFDIDGGMDMNGDEAFFTGL